MMPSSLMLSAPPSADTDILSASRVDKTPELRPLVTAERDMRLGGDAAGARAAAAELRRILAGGPAAAQAAPATAAAQGAECASAELQYAGDNVKLSCVIDRTKLSGASSTDNAVLQCIGDTAKSCAAVDAVSEAAVVDGMQLVSVVAASWCTASGVAVWC